MVVLLNRFKLVHFVTLITLVGAMLVSGCARYARNVNELYVPATNLRGGSGDVSIVIPESQHIPITNMKWVLGKVVDDENKKIDEVLSPRSPAEIIQAALTQEFKGAGYTVIPATKRSGTERLAIDLTKTEIELEQISNLADLKANCRVLVGMDIFKNGQLIKKTEYQATSSKIDIKDRDLLARTALYEALQSVMLSAVPELHNVFMKQ